MAENFPLIGRKPGKKPQVRDMFDHIAPRYDLLNRILSFGIDQRWRRKAIQMVVEGSPENVLDVATGTADLAIAAAHRGVPRVVGIDIAAKMLEIGREKIREAGLDDRVELLEGDAEALPFADDEFDAAVVAFGVRNFENLDAGLAEFQRVLKPEGRLVVLEFSRPRHFPIKQLYGFYSRFILPGVGKTVSRDSGAYRYLPESISEFPDGQAFLDRMKASGFVRRSALRLTFGVASLYVGDAGDRI